MNSYYVYGTTHGGLHECCWNVHIKGSLDTPSSVSATSRLDTGQTWEVIFTPNQASVLQVKCITNPRYPKASSPIYWWSLPLSLHSSLYWVEGTGLSVCDSRVACWDTLEGIYFPWNPCLAPGNMVGKCNAYLLLWLGKADITVIPSMWLGEPAVHFLSVLEDDVVVQELKAN